MKVYAAFIHLGDDVHYVENLDSITLWYRRNVREIISAASDEVKNRVDDIGVGRYCYDKIYCYYYRSSARKISIAFTDIDTDERSGNCLVRAIDKIVSNPPENEMKQFMLNPRSADKIASIQCEIDETKEIAKQVISDLIDRGDSLKETMAKSEKLSIDTKVWLDNSKRLNSCCTIL
jgi:hypothetical protein